MAAITTAQERAKIVMGKAEATIRELEETVLSMPEKPERSSSPWLLGAALGSIAFAITLYARNKKEDAVFVGLWAPTFLALGMFRDLLNIRRRG